MAISVRELENLAPQWPCPDGSAPLGSHEWFVSAAHAFCGDEPPHLVTVLNEGRLAGVAPLRAVRRFGVRWLEVLGTSQLHEPCILPCSDELAREQLAERLIGLGRPLVLQRLDTADPLVSLLKSKSRGRGYLAVLRSASSPFLPIGQSWGEFFSKLSSRRRYDVRRAQRRLEEAGKVSFRVHEPTAANIGELVAEFCRVEALGWKGEGGTALLHKPALRRFFELLGERLAASGSLRLFFLELDSQVVAGVLAVEQASRLWILKVGYDERLARCSPGTRLIWEAVRYAFERRLAAVEFLGTSEEWLRAWTDRHHEYSTLVYYPFRPAGALALMADAPRMILRRLVSRGGAARVPSAGSSEAS